MTGPTLLTADLWWLPTTASNAYLWRTPAGRLVVVDPGLPGDERTVLDAVRRLGGGPGDVELVVLTHFHSDHSGATPALVEQTGALVAAGTRDAAVLRGQDPAPLPVLTEVERPMYEQIVAQNPDTACAPRVEVDIDLEHGAAIDPDGALLVHATSGHTWGSIAVHIPTRSAVLTGDIGFGMPDGQTTLGPFNVDRARAHEARRELAALWPAIAGLGHGAALRSGAAHALAHAVDVFGDPS